MARLVVNFGLEILASEVNGFGVCGDCGSMNNLEKECLAYGVLTCEQTAEVVEMYEKFESYLKTSLHLSFPYSWPSVARLIRWSVEVGMLTPEKKVPVGGKPKKLESAKRLLERRPDLSSMQVTRVVGCGEATVHRARNMLRDRQVFGAG